MQQPDSELDLIDQIFKNNRKYVKKNTTEDPNYFSRLKTVNNPKILFIGCSDARVPAQSLMGLKIGELFVHRNIANQVHNNDLNLQSCIQFAIEHLDIKEIFVCGHYECAGVKATQIQQDHGIVEHWLHKLRDLQRIHREELEWIQDKEEKFRRLVELNVEEQCLNVLANPIVQKAQKQKKNVRITGFVYDVANGYLKKVKPNYKKTIQDLGYIYDLYHVHNDKQG